MSQYKVLTLTCFFLSIYLSAFMCISLSVCLSVYLPLYIYSRLYTSTSLCGLLLATISFSLWYEK